MNVYLEAKNYPIKLNCIFNIDFRGKRKLNDVSVTSKNEIRPSPIPKNWENICKKTPDRLDKPRNGSNSSINLSFRRLHLLNILHVILCAYTIKSSTQSLTYSINNHHPKYKTPMHFSGKHFKPMDRNAATTTKSPFGLMFLHSITKGFFKILFLHHNSCWYRCTQQDNNNPDL